MDLKEKLKPEHTALLVIDIQNDFASPEGLLGRGGRDLSLVDPMIEKLGKLADAAKRANVLTLYTQHKFDRSKLNDLQKEQYDLDGRTVTCDIKTDGWHFYRINPPAEDVYEKYAYSAFSSRALTSRLEAYGIKTIVITGMDAIYCVESTIRSGFDLGYKIVVPEDLIAGNARHLPWQEKTLELTKKTFGVVTSSEELERAWHVD